MFFLTKTRSKNMRFSPDAKCISFPQILSSHLTPADFSITLWWIGKIFVCVNLSVGLLLRKCDAHFRVQWLFPLDAKKDGELDHGPLGGFHLYVAHLRPLSGIKKRRYCMMMSGSDTPFLSAFSCPSRQFKRIEMGASFQTPNLHSKDSFLHR